MDIAAYIAKDALGRLRTTACRTRSAVFASLALLPTALGAPVPDYTELNGDNPNYNGFVAAPINYTDPSDGDRKVQADVSDFLSNDLDWYHWHERVAQIRLSGNRAYCVGNLSVALSNVGGAYQAGAAGATTLLTLLPTVGALLGAPATELWLLFKLVPIAGVLSMCLSLGGNLTPSTVDGYERIDQLMGKHETRRRPDEYGERGGKRPVVSTVPLSEDEKLLEFVGEVEERASVTDGTINTHLIYVLMFLQLIWLGCIVVACWILQEGSIIVWWCSYYPWVWTWYAAVVFASLVENATSVPFSQQWTMRVSRAPKVDISPDAPWLIPPPHHLYADDDEPMVEPSNQSSSQLDEIELQPRIPAGDGSSTKGHYEPIPILSRHIKHKSLLTRLREGTNTRGCVVLDPNSPINEPKEPFYVIISVKGIQAWHKALQFLSRLFSILTFTFGTALFASSTLVTILMATIVACLIIAPAIFGRMCAVGMAGTVMEYRPIIHRVVTDEVEAERYIEEMLKLPNLLVEINSHLVLNGRCIRRYKSYLR